MLYPLSKVLVGSEIKEVDMNQRTENTLKQRDKYFQGYTTYTVPKKNGKGKKTIRVYEGDLYRLDATNRQCIGKKLLCAGLVLVFYIAGIIAGLQNVDVNKGYFTIPYIIGLLFGFYCVLGIINLLISRKDMTEFEYKEYSRQIKRGSALSMYAMGVATFLYVIFLIIKLASGGWGERGLGSEILTLLCGCVCCGCAAGILFIEKKSKYIIIPGKLSKKSDKDI
jgi:hypothetical protein